jgi:DNA helicase-2/ATP-dependent DNA helicase PcrA
MSSVLLNDLNPEQKKAVMATEGPVLILAGAGSGKTNVLTRRIAYLLAEKKVSPFYVLAVTFTNKAANEMRQRVERLIGPDSRKIWIGTFHSVFGKVLRFEAEKVGYTRNYTIYDAEDQLNLVKACMEFLGISQELYAPSLMRARISRAKNLLQTSDQMRTSADSPIDERAVEIFEEYEKRLRRSNALDFDDLILKPIELFQRYPDVLSFYQDKFRYIHIDEYQDTNRAQYMLVRLLARQYQNICVVGDDDQSIYGWRHADIGNILNFEKDYSSIRVFKLEQNYRSTANILSLASSVVKNNVLRTDKTLWTRKADGERIQVFECADDREEARIIAQTIKTRIRKEKRKFSDFAILYRTNAQSRVLEDALRLQTLPYVIVGGLRFYERKEIKDILAYMKAVANPADSVSLLRILNYPPRGIGKVTIEKLEEFSLARDLSLFNVMEQVRSLGTGAIQERTLVNIENFCAFVRKYVELKDQLSLSEWVRILIEETGILKSLKQEGTIESLSRYENVLEFMNAVGDFSLKFNPEEQQESMLDGFLKEVALVTDVDQYDEEKNAVTLMTIHSSKGLEFPIVFVAGIEEGLFPIDSELQHELEEERRLFYVGATRAQRELYLSFARRRMRFNTVYATEPSRFLDEIPPNLIVWERMARAGQDRELHLESEFDQAVQRSLRSNGRRRSVRSVSVGKSLAASDELVQTEAQRRGRYQVGQHVEHPTFGGGRILSTEGAGDAQRVTILFGDGVERKLMIKYANLMVR